MGAGAAIIGAALATFATGGAGAITFGTLSLTLFQSFLVRAAVGLALNALTPKPKSPNQNRQGYQVTQRGSALDHQIIYGRVRTGGVVVYDGTTGNKNKFFHRVIAFAGHEVESFDEIWINDEVVEFGGVDYTVEVTYIRNNKSGSTTETITQVLTGIPSDLDNYSATDSIPKDAFEEIRAAAATVEPEGLFGEFSSATLTSKSSGNSSLVVGKYKGKVRINTHLGDPDQLADSDLVDEVDEWTEEHRLRGIAYMYIRLEFDRDVFPNGVPQISATIKGKKVFDPRDDTTSWSDNSALCLRDYLSEGYGLNEADANIDDTLVSAAANVCDETDTDASTTRYTCNGAFTTEQPPIDVLNDLTTSMGGLLWYAQGEWRMKPAYWVAPTLSFNEDDLRSSVAVQTRQSRRDNFNTVKGTFRGEESDWQVTDYPEVASNASIEADNGDVVTTDVILPFTDNSIEARRIARIVLERNRQQLTVNAAFGLKGFKVQVGDVINLSISRFGWTNKQFEVTQWTFGVTEEYDLQVEMTLREISENVFDEVDDGAVFERDNTNLLSAFETPDVGVAVSAKAKSIRQKLLNSLEVIVSSSSPERVDYVEVEYKASEDDDWEKLSSGDLGKYEVLDVEPGPYDVRARAINTFGIKGVWEIVFGTNVDAFAGSPSDVDNFNYEVNGDSVSLFWDAVTDADLSHYIIRFSPLESGASWANSTLLSEKVARPSVSTTVPLRSGTYFIRSVDKGGISSENPTSLVVPSVDLPQFITTTTDSHDPSFSGTKTGLSVVSNTLRLTSPVSADDVGTYELGYTDIGEVRTVWTYIKAPNIRLVDGASLFDDASGLFDDALGLFDSFGTTGLADTNIKFFISTTDDDPTGSPTWSDWKQFRAGAFSGRAFRYKIEMETSSDDVTPSLTELDAVIQYGRSSVILDGFVDFTDELP